MKIIGLVFNSTSLVFVVNGNKVKQLQDFQKPDTVVAVNSVGVTPHTPGGAAPQSESSTSAK